MLPTFFAAIALAVAVTFVAYVDAATLAAVVVAAAAAALAVAVHAGCCSIAHVTMTALSEWCPATSQHHG